MVFPAAKLASVAIRQISKPLAAALLSQAKQNKKFGHICISFANWYSRMEYRITRNFYDRDTKSAHIPKLEEKKAIELGTTVFGEAVIFSVAAVVIGFEYRRSQLKESMKEQKLQNDLTGLRHQLAEVHAENARITSSIASISTPNREVLPAHSANQAPEEHKASVNEALLSNVRRDTHKMSSHPGSNLMYASTTSRKVVADEEGEILLYSPSGVAITPSKKLTATHLPNGVIVKRLATDFASLPNAKSNTGNVNSD